MHIIVSEMFGSHFTGKNVKLFTLYLVLSKGLHQL